MFDQAYEWLRIANLDVQLEVVEKTKLAVTKFSETVDDTAVTILATVSLLVEKDPDIRTSEVVTQIISQIRKLRPEFPSDPNKSETFIKICCALYLGELLNSSDRNDKLRSAACLASALSLRASSKTKHLDEIYAFLVAKSLTTLHSEALSARAIELEDIDITQIDDVPTLMPVIANLARQAQIGREEMNLLWWLSSGFSNKAQLCIFNSNPVDAAIIGAVETAEISFLPPMQASSHVLRRVLQTNLECLVLSLKDFLSQAGEPSLTLATVDSSLKHLVAIPAVFPLSWLFFRLNESKGKGSWSSEFDARTTLDSKTKYALEDLATQLYSERIAMRLLTEDNTVK